MILFILILAFICAGIVLFEMPKKYKRQSKKLKYTIPQSFWDDFNYCVASISKMKENDVTRIENMIDNLMYQYVEMIDSATYIEKISYLVDIYNKKIKSFLLTKHLN
jgi:hypothetical protein